MEWLDISVAIVGSSQSGKKQYLETILKKAIQFVDTDEENGIAHCEFIWRLQGKLVYVDMILCQAWGDLPNFEGKNVDLVVSLEPLNFIPNRVGELHLLTKMDLFPDMEELAFQFRKIHPEVPAIIVSSTTGYNIDCSVEDIFNLAISKHRHNI